MTRRRVAILAADLCGYSGLVARDEDGTLARLLADRRSIGEAVQACSGRVFNTAGDALLAEFATAAEAFRAAVEVQRRIEARTASEPRARRMRYRIGVTVGDVLEQDGDLLGDAVNVASRLQKLAAPGGICLSRAALEAAGDAVSCSVSDIGPQRLRNMPQPVPACLVAPEAIGGGAGTARVLPSVAAAVLGIALVGASVAAVSAHRVGPVPAAAPRSFVFPPDAEMPAAEPPGHRRFAVDAVPLVTDEGRARIAAAAEKDAGVAVAVSRTGIIGLGPSGQEGGGAAAVRACFEAGGINCKLYAAGGEVVWPEPPPPLPQQPWVDPAAPRTPFDAERIAGLRDVQRRAIADEYQGARAFKAFALGPHGTWRWTSDRASAAEAERLALERCGENAGSPCRIVAVGDSFVVPLRAP